MGKELRESRLLAPSGCGRVFTQFLAHKFTHLSTCGEERKGGRGGMNSLNLEG